MADDPDPPFSLERCLAEFAERKEAGEELDEDAFLAEHPEGGEALRRGLVEMRRTEALMDSGLRLPDRVGPFDVLEELGRGAMGRVFAVRIGDASEPLALKQLHATLSTHPRFLERFRREGQALQRISHPGVVRIHEVGVAEGTPYLLMERIEGRRLSDVMSRWHKGEEDLPGVGPPVDRATRLVAHLARAVAAAHREGVLHRDIKPSNILIRDDGSPVLIDFGLIRLDGAATLTRSGDIVGTPQYMAPEQARGEPVDPRTDVYGLGALLFEILVGAPPRTGDDTLALLRRASTEPISPQPLSDASLPRSLMTIVRRSLSFYPRFRYGSAEEMASDLERNLEGDPLAARPPGVIETSIDIWLKHRMALILAAVFALLIAVAFLLWRPEPLDPAIVRREAIHSFMRAWLAGSPEQMQKALADFRKRVPEDPVDVFLESLQGGELPERVRDPLTGALIEGERLRREGRAAEAVIAFHVARNIEPESVLTMVPLGITAIEAEEWELAQRTLGFMAAFLPDSCDLHYWLGHAFFLEGDYEQTTLALRTAAMLCPQSSRIWIDLAWAHAEIGQLQEAQSCARKALQFGSSLERETLERAVFEFRQRGRMQEADAIEGVLNEGG